VAAPFDLIMASAVSLAASPSISATTTWAPSCAKVSQMARPMPAPPPVTSAILSSSRRIGPLDRCGLFPLVRHGDDFLGDARMERHGRIELSLGYTHLERNGRYLGDLGRIRSKHVYAKHCVGLRVDDEFQKDLFLTAADCGTHWPEAR